MSSSFPTRSMISNDQGNYQTPESMMDMVNHLDSKKPELALIYFHAKWNPIIPKIEKDYLNITSNFAGFCHYKVDCDATPEVKQYFDARIEPQFLILINGTEFSRMVGYNFEKLQALLERATNCHNVEYNYIGTTKGQWERFYDHYDREATSLDYDRDSMRPRLENESDRRDD